jgi:hypothetical protein
MIRVLGCLVVVLLSGCVGHYYQMPTPPVDLNKYEVVAEGEETATGIMLFQLIPIQQNSKIARATQALMEAYGGDAVTNVQVRERWFWAWVLNGYKTDVRATVLRRKTVQESAPKRAK